MGRVLFYIGLNEVVFAAAGLFIGILIAVIRAYFWKNRVNDLVEAKENFEKKNTSIETKLKNRNKTLNDLKKTLENAKQNMIELNSKNQNLTKQLDNRNETIAYLKNEVSAINDQLLTVNKHATQIENVKQKLKKSLN
jgi:chromosome segregation ATPase